MKTCPHCGAELRDTARFCPACMTSLVNKRVIRTPKYALQRWLSVAAAVFVLLAAVGAVWTLHGQQQQPAPLPDLSTGPSDTTTNETSPTEGSTTAPSTTMSAETLDPLGTTTVPVTGPHPGNVFIPFPFISVPSSTTVGSQTQLTTTYSFPTITTTTTTTTTYRRPTYTTTTKPYWINGTPSLLTEDGLPIAQLTWRTYNIFPDYYHLNRHVDGKQILLQHSATGVPLSNCLVMRCYSIEDIAPNGIYRVPAAVKGKPVAVVHFNRSFADPEVAATVKRIYLPPDVIMVTGDLTECTNLQDLWILSDQCYFYPESLPKNRANLTIHAPSGFNPLYYYTADQTGTLANACNDIYHTKYAYFSKDDPKIRALYGGGEQ